MKNQSNIAAIAFIMSAAMQASPAEAQQDERATAAANDEDVGGEIVVVAQKRAENIQDIPISVTAIGGEAMEKASIVSAYDLGRVAPNLSIQRSAQATNVRIAIRGIGAPGNSATEPSVATFLDGVYIPRPGAVVGSFLDIEGVEVLRGPQGTLFGRNASVGALSLRSALPVQSVEGSAAAEVGNHGRYLLRGIVNVPLNDDLAVRVAAQQRWFGGHWINRLDGQRFGESDETTGRLSMRYAKGAIDAVFRADYTRTKGDGAANIDFDPASVSQAQLTALQTRIGGLPDTDLSDRYANQVLIGDLRDRQWGVSANVDIDLGGDFTLRLLNNYRDWSSRQTDGDLSFLPAAISHRASDYGSKSHNHEIQLISPTDLLGGKLDFVAGLYYFSERYVIGQQNYQDARYCDLIIAAAQRPACNAHLAAGRDRSDLDFSQTVKSFAAYGQMNLHLGEALTLVFGGRWTTEDKSGHFAQTVPNPFAGRAVEDVDLALDGSRFTYRVGVNYDVAPDVMLFASHSTGYKSGGFNSGGGTVALGDRRIFDRELVKNYEFGARSQWLNRALTANITFYRMDIDGFQDRSFDGSTFTVRNAGALRHQGLELDISVRPTSNLTFKFGLAYLDSGFLSYPDAPALPGFAGTQDLTGKRANYAPAWTGNAGVTWRQPVGSGGYALELSSVVNFISDQNIGGETDNNRQTTEDGYALTSLRLSLNAPDDRWSIALFGTNIFDVAYAQARFYQPFDLALGMRNGAFPGSTAVRAVRGEPRNIGASFQMRF